MCTVEWDIPFTLTTPLGQLLINQPDPAVSNAIFKLDKSGCTATRDMRVTRDNRAQASGYAPLHPDFTGGYQMSLKVTFWEADDKLACDDLLVRMWDHLMLHTNAILGDIPVINEIGAGRIQWSPSGALVDRMLDRISTRALPVLSFEGDSPVATFAVDTAYPYAMDAPETSTTIVDGATVTLDNTGTAAFFPVVEVFGPLSAFELTNLDVVDADGNPLAIVYNGSLPGAPVIGAGDFVELAFFNETAYKNGNVADAKPGIDITESDFFPLVPGSNRIQIIGAPAIVKWQNAYA